MRKRITTEQMGLFEGLTPGRVGKDARYANRGMDLERMIEYANRRYATKGEAIIQKIHTKILPIRDGQGKIVTVRYDKSTVDYMGRIGNRPIAFEAKRGEGKRLDLGRILPQQLEFLQAWGEDIGFVLIALEGCEAAWVVPTPFILGAVAARQAGGPRRVSWRGMGWTATGLASIREADMMDAWRVPIGPGGIEYLSAVRRIWG